MRKLSLKIAILTSLVGLLIVFGKSFSLLGDGQSMTGVIGLCVVCPMIIANIVVYAHVHDLISDGKSSNRVQKKQGNSVDCITCGSLLKNNICSNCGTR